MCSGALSLPPRAEQTPSPGCTLAAQVQEAAFEDAMGDAVGVVTDGLDMIKCANLSGRTQTCRGCACADVLPRGPAAAYLTHQSCGQVLLLRGMLLLVHGVFVLVRVCSLTPWAPGQP